MKLSRILLIVTVIQQEVTVNACQTGGEGMHFCTCEDTKLVCRTVNPNYKGKDFDWSRASIVKKFEIFVKISGSQPKF